MNQLIICEKPSVARSTADVMGASQKRDGYIEAGDTLFSYLVARFHPFGRALRARLTGNPCVSRTSK
jgi:hypothetical protein